MAVRPQPRAAVTRLAAFAGLMFALALGLDALADAGLRRITTSKFGSLNRVMSGAVNAAVVVNGSSRALVHYDPRVITRATGLSAYNLGMNGVLTDVQLPMLQAYLRHNTGTKLVIQNLDAFSLKATKPGEIYDPPLYMPYLDDPDLYHGLSAIDPAVWKWRHIPLYGYTVEDTRFTWARGLLAFAGVQPPEDYVDGFNPRRLSWTGDFEAFRASLSTGLSYPTDAKAMAALEQIVDVSQAAGAKVVLVYSPEYAEAQSLVVNRREIFAAFEALARRRGVELWDYSDSPLGMQRNLFYNSQHLNADGAALFSEQLAQRLALPGITR
ncbi:hypothetical protein [Luteitalea pratensis]|uniref:hypothetical protein n=1 Tax=Luteitalea pratensis TaxID=1855912 RepID=UPI0013922CD9|nr:hypothetical protein [Luteitalea pratensis]